VSFEAKRPLGVELGDLVPTEDGRLPPVPVEARPPVDDPWRDEHRRSEAPLRKDRQRLFRDVEEAVVEAQPDRFARRCAVVEKLDSLEDIHHAVTLGGEIVHLAAEGSWADRQLVAVVGDPVVEEDPQPDALRPTLSPEKPEG
jgi:hypothetical protein